MPQGFDALPFQIDHIMARKHRRQTHMEKLALACFTYNNHKGLNIAGIDADTNAVTPHFHPRRVDWQEHFVWQGPELVVRTSVGKATIAVLAINLTRRVVLRRALVEEGIFPQPYALSKGCKDYPGTTTGGHGSRNCDLFQLRQRRLCFGEPEGHVHSAVQFDGGGQFGMGLL
jgi:hypothetical protein